MEIASVKYLEHKQNISFVNSQYWSTYYLLC